MERFAEHLRRITDPARGGSYLLGGVARLGPDDAAESFLTGRIHPGDTAQDRPDLVDHRLRVASITKAVTARTLAELVVEGRVGLGDRIGDILATQGYPRWLTTRPTTLAELLSHRSGLIDRAGYFTDPPEDLPAFLARNGDRMQGDWPSGDSFFYANLNYVLAGAVIETVTGERFDRTARRLVLDPAGIGGGFNWADVPAPERDRHVPLYQRRGTGYDLEADGPDTDWGADLIWRSGRGILRAGYRTGRDSHLLSPHAGLRLSLAELARLARHLGEDSAAGRLTRAPQWIHDGTNGDWAGGLFPEIGLGLTTYRGHAHIPSLLCGHGGHALGFTGGVWADLETGTGWAYILTGSADLTDGIGTEMFYPPEELAILRQF